MIKKETEVKVKITNPNEVFHGIITRFGNGAHILTKKEWIGKDVIVIVGGKQ